jgi:hypothetical protein
MGNHCMLEAASRTSKKFLSWDRDQIKLLRTMAKKIASDEVREFLRKAGAKGGKRGGPLGGRNRAESLTSKRRSEIARKAAKARWKKKATPKKSA